MHLVYNDPIDELLLLTQQAKKNPRIKFISVTKNELRGILKHGHADTVIPKFIATRNKLMATVEKKRKALLKELADEELTDERRTELYDIQDQIEKQEMDLQTHVPKQIIEAGYTIKVTLK